VAIVKPSDAFGEVADLLMLIVKQPYRETDLTAEEWDCWTDRILQLAEREKSDAGKRSKDAA
jgi:hypothetical protein